MYVSNQSCDSRSTVPIPEVDERNWYALLTQARHEKMVSHRLGEHGIPAFLPLIHAVRYWRNRKRRVELPLFSCYVFAKLLPTSEDQLRALRIDGVFSILGCRGVGTAIPEEQIEAVRKLTDGQVPMRSHPFLKIGQRVRIRSGALDGVQGVLVSRSGENTLIVSIEAIQRSIAVRIEGYDVEPA
jgi:transcription termination/antitermination protein NusG